MVKLREDTVASQTAFGRARALPLWSKGGIAIGVTLALVAAFLTRTLLQHGDWSDGMLAVTLAAILLAVITLLAGITRALAGRRGRWTLVQTVLLISALVAAAAGSFLAAPSLHSVQGRNAQRQGQWAEAVAEYALSGEHAPNAPGISSTLVAWGEHELSQRQYANAAGKFVAVTSTYSASGHAVVNRAWADLFRAYSAWIQASPGNVTYGGDGGALATFQQYQHSSACDPTCRAQIIGLLPLAYFQYGQQLMASQRYAEAKVQFEMVTSQYAASSYAGQAHTAAAQAYLALGRQQIAARACRDAVATYHALVAHYAGTPEAATARAALAAPQPVNGTFSGMPANPAPTVALSTHVNLSGFIFSADFTAIPNAGGSFTVPNVVQGTYNLSARRAVNNDVSYTYYHDATGNLYTVHVGPLCPVELGVIAYKA